MRALIFGLLLFGLPASCQDETLTGYADPNAVFVLQEMDGTPFKERATIQFDTTGQVRGTGPCNRYSATLSVPYPWFELGPIAASRRACPALSIEAAFFRNLTAMRLAEVQGRVLILSTTEGRELVFRAE